MAGGGCVKKFRNCELAAAAMGIPVIMEALHAQIEDPAVTVKEDRFREASDLDTALIKAIDRWREGYRMLGDRIGKDQGEGI